MDSWDKPSFEDLAIDVLEHIASVGASKPRFLFVAVQVKLYLQFQQNSREHRSSCAVDMHSMGDLSSVIPDGLLEKSLELVDKGCVVVLEAEPSGRDVIVVRRSRGSSFRSESGSGEIKDDRKAYCVWENMCTCPDFLSNPGFAAGKPAVMVSERAHATCINTSSVICNVHINV